MENIAVSPGKKFANAAVATLLNAAHHLGFKAMVWPRTHSIISSLRSDVGEVRAGAANALGYLTPLLRGKENDGAVVQKLVGKIANQVRTESLPSIKRDLIASLRKTGHPLLIDLLIEHTADNQPINIRQTAVRSLGVTKAAQATEALVEVLAKEIHVPGSELRAITASCLRAKLIAGELLSRKSIDCLYRELTPECSPMNRRLLESILHLGTVSLPFKGS